MMQKKGVTTIRMMLSKKTIFLAGIVAFTVLTMWVIAARENTAPAQPSAYQMQTKEGGNVTVEVTPQELAIGKGAIFQIVFDTHSVDLDFDVAAAAELRDEQGNSYGAAIWNGDPPGGHHRKGVLTFPTPLKQTSSSSLILKDIAGVNERTFVWKL